MHVNKKRGNFFFNFFLPSPFSRLQVLAFIVHFVHQNACDVSLSFTPLTFFNSYFYTRKISLHTHHGQLNSLPPSTYPRLISFVVRQIFTFYQRPTNPFSNLSKNINNSFENPLFLFEGKRENLGYWANSISKGIK